MRKTIHLSPADYVINILGGVRPAARALGRSPGAISKWSTKEVDGKRQGVVPTSARQVILDYAKANRLPITSEDLDYGRKIRRNA